ncbi:hypothetical protein AVEN_3301-1 [Araneus ventricosus]|uniref:Uncharacterized protein n=1 Tax=Araneus ventricosus TaxID=182803 RepID=A0A4Y2SP56_ARAVE|nr:hypothetical protein AVEN_3301-1 [Araneus ventricosus]
MEQTVSQAPALPPPQPSSSSAAASYANALKRVPPSKRKAKNVSLVFAKNKETSSEEGKETLLKALAPNKIKIVIRNVKKLAKGGVAIECDSVKGTESILNEINTNQQLSNTFEAKTPTKRLPRIVIYDVDEAVQKEEFVTMLISQNEGIREQDIKSSFNLKSKQAGKFHWDSLNVDSDVICTEEISDEQIIADIMNETEEISDFEQEENEITQRPTAKQAAEWLSGLRHFLKGTITVK